MRIVADSHGTVWDTVLSVKPEAGHSVLTVTMDARTDRLISKVMIYLINGLVKKAIEMDMDMVKAFCERTRSASQGG